MNNCTSCGAQLPPGVSYCPLCGKPTPYNVSNPNDATYVTPPNIPLAGPSTDYGSQPYGATPQNPYATTPAAPNPYAPQQPNMYNVPQQYQNAAPPTYGTPYGTGGQPFVAPPQQKKKSRIGLIVGLVILVLVLACGGVVYAVVQIANNASQQIKTTLTTIATSAPTSNLSGSPVVPSAAAIISNPRMASAVDAKYYPTTLTNSFTIKQDIYVTFSIAMNGGTGYSVSKWYSNGFYQFSSHILTLDDPTFDHGYFAATYNIATQGAVELYWCTKADCSDAQLAAVATFTVS